MHEIELKFRLVVDGEQAAQWIGTEEKSVALFYNEIRALNCAYRLAELYMQQEGGKEVTRAVAHSDGKGDGKGDGKK